MVKYFMYSAQQLRFRKEIEQKLGKQFIVGQVFVGGVKKPFTELCSSPEVCRYSDAKLVTSGDIDNIKYTLPGVNRGVR